MVGFGKGQRGLQDLDSCLLHREVRLVWQKLCDHGDAILSGRYTIRKVLNSKKATASPTLIP